MNVFTRLFVSHMVAIAVAVFALVLLAEFFAPQFYREHINRMVAAIGPAGQELHGDLEQGLRSTLTTAMISALPLALLFSAGTAYLTAKRIGHTVSLMAEGSREIAQGNYSKRLHSTGKDELAAMAQHFNQMAQALEGVERSRIELIGTVAHELRTPLAALQGYAEGLTDGVLPGEKAARGINREVRAMSRLVEDLSLVSRVEAGALEIHPQALDSPTVLSELEERFALAFAEKGVGLEVAASAGLPPIWADPERLQQVLSNLLVNALRHTPAGKQVTVGVTAEGEAVRFYVQDRGSGIAPEYRQRIFERFYRVDPARSRKDGGTGVGLTVAKGLVEAMRGEMGVESESGQGSTFWFTLPFTQT